MKMSFQVNPDATIRDVEFTGCTGLELVHNVKEALAMLRVENPALDFSEAAKAGAYNALSDEEYQQLLSTIKRIANLFHYPDDPGNAKQWAQMNVLTLLANAITELVRLGMILEEMSEGPEL